MRRSFTKFALLLALILTRPVLSKAQTSQGGELTVPYSGTTATVLVANTPATNLNVTSGTNTFILSVNPVNNSVRLYITNDTANSCAALTVNMFSTGSQAITSFNQNLASWQPLNAQVGAGQFLATNPITLPASGNVAVTSGPIIGNKLTLQIVNSPAGSCATTNLEAQAVFGQFTAPNSGVGGLVPVGSSFNGFNPLVCGGIDPTTGHNNSVLDCVMIPPGQTINAAPGLSIGGSGFAATPIGGSVGGNETYPNTNNGGPLLVVPTGIPGSGQGSFTPMVVTKGSLNQTSCNNTASRGCPGLVVADAGFITFVGGNPAGGTLIANMGNLDGGNGSEVQFCRIDVTVIDNTGGGHTLDIYFQDSPTANATDYTDRIHFAQFTTGGRAWATLSATAGATTPTVKTQATLAANTIVNGAMGTNFQVTYVSSVGSNWNPTVYMNCK